MEKPSISSLTHSGNLSFGEFYKDFIMKQLIAMLHVYDKKFFMLIVP